MHAEESIELQLAIVSQVLEKHNIFSFREMAIKHLKKIQDKLIGHDVKEKFSTYFLSVLDTVKHDWDETENANNGPYAKANGNASAKKRKRNLVK